MESSRSPVTGRARSSMNLNLTETKKFATGIIVLEYIPAKS
jgi:hypothetical protein